MEKAPAKMDLRQQQLIHLYFVFRRTDVRSYSLGINLPIMTEWIATLRDSDEGLNNVDKRKAAAIAMNELND